MYIYIYCNYQVYRDFLITLFIWPHAYSVPTCANFHLRCTCRKVTTATQSEIVCIYIPIKTESYLRRFCNLDKHRPDETATCHWICPTILLSPAKLNSFLPPVGAEWPLSCNFTCLMWPLSYTLTRLTWPYSRPVTSTMKIMLDIHV
jgi:hypothetical protein